MKGGAEPRGYTIVETLIFLAVSGALFFTAALFINGRQRQTEFTQSVRNFESQLQDIANNISTGYYQRKNDLRCTTSGPTATPAISRAGGSAIGTNSDCIYIGNVVHFSPSNDASRVTFYPIAGNRFEATGVEVSSLERARPVAMVGGGYDGSETITLPGGMQIGWVRSGGAAGTTVRALGIFTTFSNTSPSASGLRTGAAFVDLYGIPVAAAANSAANLQTEISANYATWGAAARANPANGIVICLRSGAGNQHAILTVGGNNRQYSSFAEIKPGACPA